MWLVEKNSLDLDRIPFAGITLVYSGHSQGNILRRISADDEGRFDSILLQKRGVRRQLCSCGKVALEADFVLARN